MAELVASFVLWRRALISQGLVQVGSSGPLLAQAGVGCRRSWTMPEPGLERWQPGSSRVRDLEPGPAPRAQQSGPRYYRWIVRMPGPQPTPFAPPEVVEEGYLLVLGLWSLLRHLASIILRP